MARVPLHNVRVLSLREIAELWAPEADIPVELMLRELRLAVINIPRRRERLGLIEEIPPDDELPDPDERVDRDWLIEFCEKQGWNEPSFWFDRQEDDLVRFAGRPGYRYRPALERELRRRAEAGELHRTLAAEMRYLRQWALDNYPDEQPPTIRTLENAYRALFRDLSRTPQN